MRTIVAGSRGVDGFRAERLVAEAIEAAPWTPTVVLSGTARGVDRAGEAWAKAHGVPLERYSADWNREGRRAGFLRNERMADRADALVAVWDGRSNGTRHMIDAARRRGLFVHVLDTRRRGGGEG